MADRLAGKVAIITGGANGMGAASAVLFANEGAKVVITDLDEANGTALAAEIGEDKAVFVRHDVANEDDWNTVVETAKDKFGGIDVLINNAVILTMKPLEETSLEEFNKIQNVNVNGVFLGCKAVAPTMKEAGKGSIVNVSSAAGIYGQAFTVAYSASKYAVRGITQSLSEELGVANVRVNSVHPGAIVTNMTAASGATEDSPLPLCPLNRNGMPKEVATTLLFLASDEASYITGAELTIDGGLTVGISPQIFQMMGQLG